MNASVPFRPLPAPANPAANNLCLATNCGLLTDAGKPGSSRQVWVDLDRHLQEHGSRLVLVSSAIPESPLPFPVIQVPFWLRDYTTQFPNAGLAGGMIGTADFNLLQADIFRANHAYPPGEAIKGMFACRDFFGRVLDTLRPGYVLGWDPAYPVTQILQSQARERGLPVQGIERGLLPETMVIESQGMQAWTDLRTHWLADGLDQAKTDPAAFQRIRSYYLARKPIKYAQAEYGGGGAEIRKKLGLENQKIVLFLGGGYEANGHAPKGGVYERHYFTGYPTTNDALMGLWHDVCRRPGTALVFKPHPLDPQPYSVAKVVGVKMGNDFNVHALIDAADVVAVQYTTLQFEAALYDKPILLLARSAWWGRKAAYEVGSPGELPAVLDAALARRNWPEYQAGARHFITWMMEHFLIGTTERTPARKNLRDLARYVARLSIDSRNLPSAEDRWHQTEQAVAAMRNASDSSAISPLPPAQLKVIPSNEPTPPFVAGSPR
jgi:hypothetical protein